MAAKKEQYLTTRRVAFQLAISLLFLPCDSFRQAYSFRNLGKCNNSKFVTHGGQVFAPFENTFNTRIPIFKTNEFQVQFIVFAIMHVRYI